MICRLCQPSSVDLDYITSQHRDITSATRKGEATDITATAAAAHKIVDCEPSPTPTHPHPTSSHTKLSSRAGHAASLLCTAASQLFFCACSRYPPLLPSVFTQYILNNAVGSCTKRHMRFPSDQHASLPQESVGECAQEPADETMQVRRFRRPAISFVFRTIIASVFLLSHNKCPAPCGDGRSFLAPPPCVCSSIQSLPPSPHINSTARFACILSLPRIFEHISPDQQTYKVHTLLRGCWSPSVCLPPSALLVEEFEYR